MKFIVIFILIFSLLGCSRYESRETGIPSGVFYLHNATNQNINFSLEFDTGKKVEYFISANSNDEYGAHKLLHIFFLSNNVIFYYVVSGGERYEFRQNDKGNIELVQLAPR